MSQVLDDLTKNVTAITNAAESAITLLGNIKTKLDEAIAANNNGDATALQALSDTLGTETQHLTDAITANTPAA